VSGELIDKGELVCKSLDVMQRLESKIKETVGLACMNASTCMGEVLAEVQGTSGFCYHLEIGYKIPIHTAAPCKAILAFVEEEKCKDFVEHATFKKHTQSTITTPAGYYDELKAVRDKGYSQDVSEEIEGCHCVGVPIFDEHNYPVAALWTTGVSGKIPVRDFDKIAGLLKKGAGEISRRLSSGGKKITPEYTQEIVAKAEKMMQGHLNETLEMEEVAARLYVGYSWFRKVFKEQTGMSPNQYHVNVKITRAKELLTTTDLSVREISEQLGFKSQNHFSSLFKRKTGVSPNGFRQF